MSWENLPSTNTPLNDINLNKTSNLAGFIQMYAGSTAPTGWLLCDGSAISRTTYSDLYAVIGTTYGTGDGSTTFNLPDLRGRVGVGKSSDAEFDTLGETGGEKKHTLTIQEMPSHNHEGLNWIGNPSYHISLNAGSYFTDGYNLNFGSTSDNNNICTANNGGGQAHNILQPYIVINYIIKT